MLDSLLRSPKVYGNHPVENMERKICILVPLLLLLLPVCVLNQRAKEFIHIQDNMRGWTEAQNYCRHHHTDLITIRDESENHQFFHGWIGLYRENSDSEWKWSRGDETANFITWHPNDPSSGEDCAFTHSTEKVWHADVCNKPHSFMCYDEKLLLVKESKTWEEALQHCRALRNGRQPTYDLATLLTADDWTLARRKAQKAETEVWIGLRFLAGRWMWMGGEAVQNQRMKNCPSVGFCGILTKNTSTIATQNCAQKKNFLCYR